MAPPTKRIAVSELASGNLGGAILSGTLGQHHRGVLLKRLGHSFGSNPGGEVLVLDFSGIEAVTPSYLRALPLALLASGADFAEGKLLTTAMGDSAPPLNVYPMVARLENDVRDTLNLLLNERSIPLLEATEFAGDQPPSARVLGRLDRSLLWTVELLAKHGPQTAQSMHSTYPPDNGAKTGSISVNAWINRLNELNKLRFASREKNGRSWEYCTIVKEILHG